MDFETTWYEFSPYLYVIVGTVLVSTMKSGLLIFSGVLLLIAAGAQFRLRWAHRRKMDSKVPTKPPKHL